MSRRSKMRLLVLVLCLVSAVVAFEECRDGIQDAGEECDDGNGINNDGCSSMCKLESHEQWLCEYGLGTKTTCCPALVHPVSMEIVCTCHSLPQPSASMGFMVTSDCRKFDIDECNTENGGCTAGGICTNVDIRVEHGLTYNSVVAGYVNRNGLLQVDATHSCTCPPGTIGDGRHVDCQEGFF
jgi:cysteine-rich repeat protein